MKQETFYCIGAVILGAGLAIRVTLYCLAIWYFFNGSWQIAIALAAISEFLLFVLNTIKEIFD